MSPEQVRGETGGRALGPLRARRRALRDAHRPAGLRARFGGRDDVGDPARGAAGDRDPRRAVLAGPRPAPPALPREAPRRALPVGARSRLRSQVAGLRRLVDQPGRRRRTGLDSDRTAPRAGACCSPQGWSSLEPSPAGWLQASCASPPRPPRRRLRPTFRQLTKLPGGEGNPSIAPDGESFVFVKRDGGDADLFLQRIDGAKPIPLTADCAQDDTDPAFSPDGRTIAYRSECGGGGIFVMGATGESSRRVTDFGYAPAWSPDALELAVVTEEHRAADLAQFAQRALGGEARFRRAPAGEPTTTRWLRPGRPTAAASPSGACATRPSNAISGASPPTAPRARKRPPSRSSTTRRSTGRRSTRATAAGSTSPRPAAAPSTSGVWRSTRPPARRRASPSRSPPRRAGPVRSTSPPTAAASSSSTATPRPRSCAPRSTPRARSSPPRRRRSSAVRSSSASSSCRSTASRIVFTNEDMPQHLHLVHADGTGYRQLTTGDERNRQGSWSPQGDWIAFQTNHGESSLAAIHPDGGARQPIAVGRGFTNPRWSPDGKALLTFNTGIGGMILDLAAGFGSPVKQDLPPVAPGVLFWPIAWSPDGSLVAGTAVTAGQVGDIHLWSIADRAYRRMPWAATIWSTTASSSSTATISSTAPAASSGSATSAAANRGGSTPRARPPHRQYLRLARRPCAHLDRQRRRVGHLADDARRKDDALAVSGQTGASTEAGGSGAAAPKKKARPTRRRSAELSRERRSITQRATAGRSVMMPSTPEVQHAEHLHRVVDRPDVDLLALGVGAAHEAARGDPRVHGEEVGVERGQVADRLRRRAGPTVQFGRSSRIFSHLRRIRAT